MVLAGSHPDVTTVRTEQLSIGVDEVRSLVRKACLAPTAGRWQIIIVEDADRVTERGADALLKAIEEPNSRTVWMLAAPTAEDVVVTIRSRSRQVNLVTPSDESVAALLIAEGVPEKKARFAARVSQGHIGRARAMATSEEMQTRRKQILALPSKLSNLGACLDAASWAVTTAQEEAAEATATLDAQEQEKLRYLIGSAGKQSRGATGQMKDLEEQQSMRAKRLVRDGLDSVLRELTSYYRDTLVVQTQAEAPLVNEDMAAQIRAAAKTSTPEATLRRIDAIIECRTAIATNVPPQLAFEAMMVALA
jgi:DNA polymerase-3 subunit delta'